MKRWPIRAVARVLAMSAIIGVGKAAAQAPARDPVVETVRTELIKRLEQSKALAKLIVVDPQTLKGIGQNGVNVSISLDNLIAEWRMKPAQRAELIERFARTIEAAMAKGLEAGTPTLTSEQFRAALRPVIRHKSMLDQSRTATAANPGQAILGWPLAGDAVIHVAVDGAENVRMINADETRSYDLSPDAALAQAKANVRALLPGLKIERSRTFVTVSVEEDYYSGAMLLLPETIAAIEKELGPGFVVLLPDRNLVLAAKLADRASLLRAGSEMAKQRRTPLLIPHLLQRDGDGWRALQ